MTLSRPCLALLAASAFLAVASPLAAVLPPKPTVAEAPAFEMAQISPNTWYGRFGTTNCSWIDLGDGVLVIDTGGSEKDAKNVIAQVKETTKGKPIRWVAMTHLHGDSNNGLPAFLATDATLFVNARASSQVAAGVRPKTGGKTLSVIGVADRVALFGGAAGIVDIGVPPGSAHTSSDLYVFQPSTGELFAGDLVSPDRCPMMSDPSTDPKGWIAALDRIESLGALALVPTRGNATKAVGENIQRTRGYIQRIYDVVLAMKKKGAPEAQVSSRLILDKIEDYCPRELDAINALSIYRRIDTDGTVQPGAFPPAPKKKK
jgi:glyoxylase-like metal-dependent hydrolase (beta-lactamase superfamily II)